MWNSHPDRPGTPYRMILTSSSDRSRLREDMGLRRKAGFDILQDLQQIARAGRALGLDAVRRLADLSLMPCLQ
ncbi:hypothetical protein [Lichenicola sp.]|uniref:hypothetical protein n=1 Tax=Lichenicola sp. TaxID=2804529 RepID=UPI003B00FCF2